MQNKPSSNAYLFTLSNATDLEVANEFAVNKAKFTLNETVWHDPAKGCFWKVLA